MPSTEAMPCRVEAIQPDLVERADALFERLGKRPDCIIEAAMALELKAAIAATRPDDNLKLTEANHDCLAKARPGEPMFILLGRDPDAHNIVRLWAQRRRDAGDPGHAIPVLDIADAMQTYAAQPENAPESAPPASAYPPINDDNLKLLREAAEKALNYIENTEGELGIALDCGDALRAALTSISDTAND